MSKDDLKQIVLWTRVPKIVKYKNLLGANIKNIETVPKNKKYFKILKMIKI